MSIFGDVWGIGQGYALADARAMTPQEISNWQVANLASYQQAVRPDSYWLSLGQYKPIPERPLNERFADFKVRLAAAVARRGK